jgi:uncharacterized protein YndB with AHSA1/START domain
MLKTILLGLAAVIVVGVAIVLVLAAMKPDSFSVRRVATIAAPPERIYPLIADFKAWGAWSPWEKKDPNLQRSFSGAESGPGARYAWAGDRNVGEGSMEIVEAAQPSSLRLNLDFLKPFEAHNQVDFALQPRASGTEVVWTMTGPVPFLAKIIHVFFNMDRMVGGDFEAGLAALKHEAER